MRDLLGTTWGGTCCQATIQGSYVGCKSYSNADTSSGNLLVTFYCPGMCSIQFLRKNLTYVVMLTYYPVCPEV